MCPAPRKKNNSLCPPKKTSAKKKKKKNSLCLATKKNMALSFDPECVCSDSEGELDKRCCMLSCAPGLTTGATRAYRYAIPTNVRLDEKGYPQEVCYVCGEWMTPAYRIMVNGTESIGLACGSNCARIRLRRFYRTSEPQFELSER